MIRVIATSHGAPALHTLHEVIAGTKLDDALEPVTVLVPTNYVGLFTRRALGSGELGPISRQGSGLVGIDFLTVFRLAELLGAPALALQRRRPVSNVVVAAALRGVLTRAPGMFADVVEHPSTERALVRTHRELRDLDDAQLDLLAAASPRAAEVIRIHRATVQALAPDWYDEFDLMAAAQAAVAASRQAVSGLGHVVLHLPRRLTAAEAALLRAVSAVLDVTAIVGVTGAHRADEAGRHLCRQLGAELPSLEVDAAVADRIITTSDADDEVRHALRMVVNDAVAGVPLERIALLHGAVEPYARLLDEHLATAGIERNGNAVRTVADSLVGRFVSSLLELPDRGVRRSDVIDLLAGAPIREYADRGALVPLSAWDRVARTAGVVAGGDQWNERLARFIREQRADVEHRTTADPDDPRIRSAERDIALAERLRVFVTELMDRYRSLPHDASWPELCGWLSGALTRYLGPEDVRAEWPERERAAADHLDAMLDRLRGLAQLEERPGLTTFRRTLEVELDTTLGRVGEFGRGVFTGRVADATGVEFDRVYLLGMAEGTFPARAADDSLLPDHERSVLDGALPLRAGAVHDDHADYLAAVASARDSATLFAPRGDLRRSVERVPSRWLLDTASHHAGERRFADDLTAAFATTTDWFDEVPSFVAGIASAPFPATAQEHDIASLLAGHDAGRPATEHSLADREPSFARALELITARAGTDLTRFDGNLAGCVSAAGVRTEVVSPTRLEQWARCPHAYFQQHVLGVQPLEPPEAIERLTALDRGDLIHRALDLFLQEIIDDPDTVPPSAAAPYSDDQHRRLLHIAAELCDALAARGQVGKAIYWRRDRRALLADLAQLLLEDGAGRSQKGTLIASELGFGLPDSAAGPVDIALGAGRVVRFRGSADRVERLGSDKLVVIDYKTGKSSDFTKLEGDDPVLRGAKLQLPIYAAAARQVHGDERTPVHAAYWFCTSQPGRWRWIGYDVDESVMARFVEVITVIVDGIETGLFPHRPPPADNPVYIPCNYCDPDGLGTGELRAAWDRKHRGPAMRPFIELVEPELLDEPAGEPEGAEA